MNLESRTVSKRKWRFAEEVEENDSPVTRKRKLAVKKGREHIPSNLKTLSCDSPLTMSKLPKRSCQIWVANTLLLPLLKVKTEIGVFLTCFTISSNQAKLRTLDDVLKTSLSKTRERRTFSCHTFLFQSLTVLEQLQMPFMDVVYVMINVFNSS